MIKIDSFSLFVKYIFIIFLIIYFSFKIFNYFYAGNYCDYFSDVVQVNSPEDVKETRQCINTFICEIWSNRISLLNNESNDKIKSFSCIRKYEPWVWSW